MNACVPGACCVLVSFDAVEHELRASRADGEFSVECWREARSASLALVEQLLRSPAPRLQLVIADDAAPLTSMRTALFRLARDGAAFPARLTARVTPLPAGAAHLQLFVDAPQRLAAARNDAREGLARVPADVFSRTCSAFERPGASAHTLRVDAEAPPHAAGLWTAVLDAWGPAPPKPPAPEELEAVRALGQAGNEMSEVHVWDVQSRRKVGQAVQRGASSPDPPSGVPSHGNSRAQPRPASGAAWQGS